MSKNYIFLVLFSNKTVFPKFSLTFASLLYTHTHANADINVTSLSPVSQTLEEDTSLSSLLSKLVFSVLKTHKGVSS